MGLFAAGLSHKTAPVELREHLAVDQAELANRARTLKSRGELDEIVLLSTCNRVEIYGTTRCAESDIKSLFHLLCSEPRELNNHVYIHKGVDAIRHLFCVAAGLDSMVLGETEITDQIKNAYEIARATALTGPLLNRLFQKAFQATKEIRTRTGIGRGAVSIKSAAVELVEKTLGDISRQSIMVIGAGEMAECCVRRLAAKGVGSILISNRSFDRAFDLAMRFGGEAVCFGDCLFGMRDVDVVIAATSSPESLLTRGDAENLMRARRHRPLLLIDLSVPRNIDSAVRDLENVSLFNVDDVQAMTRHGIRNRERELAACHRIINAHVAALVAKWNLEAKRRDQRDCLYRSGLSHSAAGLTCTWLPNEVASGAESSFETELGGVKYIQSRQ
jgi:glutamyl-tRNA reductase